MNDEPNRLMMVKHISELGLWIVDPDSQYILEGDGGFHPTQQLEVAEITPIAAGPNTPAPRTEDVYCE